MRVFLLCTKLHYCYETRLRRTLQGFFSLPGIIQSALLNVASINNEIITKVFIISYCCPVKMSLPGLKPNTGAGFISPSLKAGVIKLKPLSIGL